MELAQVIKERRSIQLYEDRPVSIEELKELLETAVWAPNHKMTQPWRFIFVSGESRTILADINRKIGSTGSNPEERKANGEKAYQKLMGVPAFLIVVTEENPNMKLREEDFAATSTVIQNFSLLAWEKGIGMIWKSGKIITEPAFREALGIKPGEKVTAMMQIGYPAKVPKAIPRADISEKITELN